MKPVLDAPYRILSFDGGPSVATTVRCLQQIEAARPGFLERTQHFVGSSAGAQVAVYLGHLLDNGKDGATALSNCVDFVDELLTVYAPPAGALLKLLEGKDAMMTNVGVGTWLQEQIGEQTTLGDLYRRVSVLSARADKPWNPEVVSNFSGILGSPVRPTEAVNAAIQSGSFPLWLPLRDGHVDGALYSNCPAMAGFGAAYQAELSPAAKASMLHNAVVFSLGGMDGSSSLSNLFTPPLTGNEAKPLALPAHGTWPTAKLADVDDARSSAQQIRANLMHELNSQLGMDIDPAVFPVTGNSSWGWQSWLAYPWNLGYFLQVWMNSMGRGVSMLLDQMLGNRAFRLGPVTLLGSNEAFLCELLGQPKPIIAFADFTAKLWGEPDPPTGVTFEPTFEETLAWVDTHWMPHFTP